MPCYVAGNMAVVHTFDPKSGRCDCGETTRARPDWATRNFNPGPPSMTKRQRRNRAHDAALIEDAERQRNAAATASA